MTDRIEQAAPDVRGVLEDAWCDHHGYPLECHPIEAKCPYCNKFRRFLDAEAYTDAALMLVPEGWLTRLVSFAKGNDSTSVYWRCGLRTWYWDDDGVVHPRGYICVSDTPALAIAAAALRAKGTGT